MKKGGLIFVSQFISIVRKVIVLTVYLYLKETKSPVDFFYMIITKQNVKQADTNALVIFREKSIRKMSKRALFIASLFLDNMSIA